MSAPHSPDASDPAEPRTLRDLQQAIDAWIGQFEEGYWPAHANLARLIEEVGELAREINHHHGPKKKKTSEDEGSVEDELADVILSALTLGNALGLDMEAVVGRKLRAMTTRDRNRWVRKNQEGSSSTT